MHYPHAITLRLAACLLAAFTLMLAGCPGTQDDNAGRRQIAVQQAEGNATSNEPPAELIPPDVSLVAWELDGFRLGMDVLEARALLSGEIENYIQEMWQIEGVTGVIVAGTYKEPIRMQGSLMFYDGELVAVIANKLQENIAFKQRLGELGKVYGESRRDPPEFARGYRFVEAMAADERQPDIQYLWADEPTQTLLLAGYYSNDLLATYMLIDASRYDLVAEAMEGL
jgi:hypothetical protein